LFLAMMVIVVALIVILMQRLRGRENI